IFVIIGEWGTVHACQITAIIDLEAMLAEQLRKLAMEVLRQFSCTLSVCVGFADDWSFEYPNDVQASPAVLNKRCGMGEFGEDTPCGIFIWHVGLAVRLLVRKINISEKGRNLRHSIFAATLARCQLVRL